MSSAGNVEVTSDGVTVVEENSPLTGVVVFDGEPCDHKGKVINLLFFFFALMFMCIVTLYNNFSDVFLFFFIFADVFENVTFSHHELVRNKETQPS